MPPDEDAVLQARATVSVQDAARLLNVSDTMICRLYDRGELVGYKAGCKRLIYADSIDAYKERHANRGVQLPAKPPVVHFKRRVKRPVVTPQVRFRFL
jgi:excisionase family DNA binding protein